MTWETWLDGELSDLTAAGRRRAVRDVDGRGVTGKLADGRSVVCFASNDYLGLSHHPAVIAAAHHALDRWGAGAGSARLIVGSRPIHTQLETDIAAWKGTERALLFPNGFAANLGVLQALGARDVLICSDELNHASIIDGCRSAAARTAVYPHCDLGALEELLKSSPRSLVVTDAVFSMDGDLAPLAEIAAMCRRHDAILVVDEAHSVLDSRPPMPGELVVHVGTLSKFLGAAGGFVAASARVVQLLLNRARPFIFTTASPPADAAAARAALGVFRSDEGAALRRRLRALIDHFRPGHPSPIVPIVVGEERRALEVAHALLERGFLVPAIRPPSVPPGSARLRVALSADHTAEQVEALMKALADVAAERVGA